MAQTKNQIMEKKRQAEDKIVDAVLEFMNQSGEDVEGITTDFSEDNIDIVLVLSSTPSTR